MRFQFNPFTDKLDISGMGPGGTTVQFLTGNDGIPVPSDSGYNINVDGENATGINTTGNAGTNTLTIHGLASTTTQVGTTRYATNAEAAAQGVNSAALTPSNITNFFSNNPVPASQGGTGLSSPAAHSLLVTEGSSAVTRLGVAGNGQIPIGHVGADPVLANITSSGGTITVTNGPGTINIDTSGELVLTFDADSGSAMPSGAVITISGGSTGLTTTGSAATISLAGTLGPTYGGTGVNNGSSTITIGGNVTFSGAHTFTGTVTGTTTVTFPTSGTLLAGTVTQYDVLVGGASSAVASVGPGSAGQVLQSGGNAANPTYSTATYPATASGTGTILRADGTNWVATTTTYPNTNAVNTIMYATSANVLGSITAVIDGVLISDHAAGVPSWLANGTAGGGRRWTVHGAVSTLARARIIIGSRKAAVSASATVKLGACIGRWIRMPERPPPMTISDGTDDRDR